MQSLRIAAPSLRTAATAAGVLLAIMGTAAPAHAQNDWQYPDPYFGILEIEKSHDGATWRKYRSDVAPGPRATRPAPAAPVAEPASAAARPQRTRWKSRWRR
jgi:hypothetical protein